MADQQRRVSLIFDADSSRAKTQIENLIQSINRLMDSSMRSTGVASLDKDLQMATKNAAQLQIQLQKATNVKTGKLDLTKFNDSLRESGMTLDKYQQSFAKVGSVGQQAFTGLARSIATAEIPLRRTNSLLNDFAVTMKNTVKWQLSSSIMHGFLSSVQSAMSYAQHLNQNLTDIRIVTGQSADEMARFAEQANKSAKELSATTNQYAQAALIFYQQGLSDKAVKERTDAVIKMANVTGEAAKDVSSYMTAIWNNFDDGSKSLEYYADVITKLGAATAASSEEIAGGLEKFAAVGNTIGLSYEYATAMLTTIIDKTRQSEDVVGTALKTILARIQGLNLGETLDDGTNLNKYSAALASVGVQIKDASGQLRDMDAILNDLGGKWQSLSKDTQVALAQVVGGVRQYNQILSLMDNWDAFEMNLDIAFNAEGELNKQAEIYAESWEAAQKRVQAALESIYSALIDDTFFIKMNDSFADLLEMIKQFIDGIGGVSGLLTSMGSILLTVFGSQITASLKNLTNNIRMLTKTGREELVTIQKQAQTLLSKQDYGKGVGAQGIKSAYESEARAQLALLNNAKKLTEEEQAIANILMQQHHIRVDEQVALGNQLNELEKIEQRQIGIFDSAKDKLTDMLASEGDSSSLKHSFSWIDGISQQIILLQDDFGSLSAAIDGAFGTGEGGANVAAQRLLDNLNNIKVSSPEAKRALEEFKNAMTQAGTDVTAQSQAFNNLELALGEMGQIISDNERQILELFNNMRQAAQGNEELTRAINVTEQAYRNYINTSERVQNTKQELIVANGRVIASEEAVQAVLKASGAVYLSVQQSIVAVAQIASTLGSLLNTFKGLRESIKEGDVSFGQLLTTFGFLIPQVLSLIGNFKNLTMTTYGAIAAGKLFSTEKLAEAAAANVAKGAVVGFGTALKTSLPIYALITGAIIGLIALFKSLTNLMNESTAYEKHVEEMKKLNEQIEENKEKAKNATESVKNLYAEFADYTDALDALSKLTKGTEAWNEQLTSTKNLANILLDSMPVLADIVANPQKYGMVGKIRDENGNFTQEVLDLAFNTQRAQESLTVYSSSFSQREAAKTRGIEAEQGAMLRGEEYTNISNENYVGASGAYERNIWTILAPLMPELVKLYNPQMTSDSELVSGETLLTAIKNSPLYFKDGVYTKEGRNLVNSLIFGAERSNLPGTYDLAGKEVYAKLKTLAGLDVARNGVITVNEGATSDQIDAIITTTMGTIVDTEATDFLNILAKDYSNIVEPVISNQIGEEGSQTYFDYAGELAALNMGFSADQMRGNETFARALGNYIAKQVDSAYSQGKYSSLTSEDFAKTFRIEGVVYDPKSDTLTYNNPKAGQEGEEDTVTISNARDTYAATAEVEKLGYVYGDYTKAATVLGYENPALIGRLFENKGSLTGFSAEEVKRLSSAGLSSYLPDTVIATLKAIEEKGLQNRDYSIGEAIVNAPIDAMPKVISDLLNNAKALSLLSDEELALLTGQNYSTENGLLQAAEALRSIESVGLSYTAYQLEKGISPAKAYENMAGNMADIASIIQKLQNGDTITEKEYGTLGAAGLNLSRSSLSGTKIGEYEGTLDIESALDTMLKTQILGEKFNLSDGRDSIGPDTKKEILKYLRYNIKNATEEEIDDMFKEVSNETLSYIDTYYIGEEVANFIGVLGFGAKKYLEAYGDKYDLAMAQAQAKIDKQDWDTLLTYAGDKGITDQSSYDMAVANLNRQTGTNQLISGLNGWITQFDEIINKENFDELISNGSELGDSWNSLIEALSLILGFEVDTQFIKDNWGLISSLNSGSNSANILATMSNRKVNGNWLTGQDFSAYGAQLDFAFLQKVGEVKAGDIYSQAAQAILNSLDVNTGFEGINRNLFDMALQDSNLWDTEKNKIANEDLFLKWLEEVGIIRTTIEDSEGNIITLKEPQVMDEALLNAGYETAQEVIDFFVGAIRNGAGEYDIDFSGFDSVVREVYSNLDFANQVNEYGLKIWATKDQMETGANALNKAYEDAGILGLSTVSKWLKEAGNNAPKLAAALSNIDWSASNAFDLASIALSDAGLNAEDYADALNSIINVTQIAVEALTTLADAIGIFSTKTGLADKIRAGESFTENEYDQLVDQYGEETARGMVERQADGSYIYTGNNANIIAQELEQQSISGLQEVQKTNQDFLNSSDFINTAWTSLDSGWLEYLANSVDSNGNNIYGFSPEQQKAMLGYSSLTSDEDRMMFATSDIMKGVDWEAISQLATVNATRNVEESGEMMEDAGTRIPRENWEQEVTDLGLDVNEVDKLGDSIQEMAEGMSEAELEAMGLSKALVEDEQLADDLAKTLKRYNRAVEDVTKNSKEWKDALKSKDWEKSAKAIDEVKDSVEDMLDLPPDSLEDIALSAEEAAEMLELMEKAADGDQDALDELQALTAEKYIVEGEVQTNFDQTSFNEAASQLATAYDDLPVGEPIIIGENSQVDSSFWAACSEILAGFATTEAGAKQAQKAFESLGYDAEVEAVTVPVDQAFVIPPTLAPGGNIPYGLSTDGAFFSNVTVAKSGHVEHVSGEQTVLAIKSITPNGNGFGGNVGTRNRGRRGGGGGGGGGGSRRPTAEKKKEPDKERYHTITNQLEDLTDSYDKVSKAADRAFGKARIKLLQDQRKELQKLAAAQQSYIDEINDYYKQDLSNLDQVSAYVGFNVQLDENGTITNFDEIQNKMWEEYNSHINDKGEVIDMDEEVWKDYEEEWNRIMELITQYEETQDLRKEALQQLQDYINEIYDLQLEEVTYSVEIDIEASEYALEILDYLLKQVEDDAWSAAEAIAYMGDQATDFLHQSQTYNSGIADILRNHTKNITDANGKILKGATLTEEDIQGYLKGDQASLDKVRELGLKGEFTDEEIQSLKDYHSQLLAINQSLIDLRNQVYDTLLDSFSKFNEELQDTIDIMEHLTKVTDSYRNIIDLVGKKNVGISNALLESFSQIQTNQARDLVKAQKSRLDDLTKMRDEAEVLRQKMLADGNEKDAKEIEKRIKEMNEQIREATEDYTSALENALQRAEDQFKLHISNIIEDANQAFAGAMGNIQQLQDMFNLKNDTNDIYLEDFEKIYELNKLNRDITNSIDETSNIKAKEELVKLQAEINALEEDGVKVSQYQTEDLRRRYELKLAEIALNEAKDAKSQVQMTRDADGNWNYIYTADENQVAEAEQNYEDRLYELQRANAEYINEMQDLLIQTEAELMAKIEEITNDQTLSLEEKQDLIDQFTAQYTEKFNGYAEELNLVLDNNKILYEDEWTAYSNLTGYKISADENYIDSFNETMLSTLTGFQTAEEFHQNFNDTTETLLSESNVAFEEWEYNVDEVFEAAGLSSEDLAGTLEKQFNNISNESENLAEDIEDTGDRAVEVFRDITDAVDNWYQQYSATIDRVLNQNTALAESFRTLLSSWSDYQAGSGVDDSGDDSEAETPTDGGEPAEEGSDVQDSVAEKTEKYKKAIAFAVWSHPNSGWGHGNSSKKLTSGDRYNRLKAKGLDPNTVQQQINAYSGKSAEYMKKDSGIDFKNWEDRVKALDPYTYKKFAFDTGGYTGSWGDEGRWALLHEKEIVLNKEDTSNLLSAIGMIRQIAEVIDLNAYSSAGFGSGIGAAASVGSTGTLEQVVHVTAEFPNATNKDEIYAAFGEIVNLASQYANRR